MLGLSVSNRYVPIRDPLLPRTLCIQTYSYVSIEATRRIKLLDRREKAKEHLLESSSIQLLHRKLTDSHSIEAASDRIYVALPFEPSNRFSLNDISRLAFQRKLTTIVFEIPYVAKRGKNENRSLRRPVS